MPKEFNHVDIAFSMPDGANYRVTRIPKKVMGISELHKILRETLAMVESSYPDLAQPRALGPDATEQKP